MKSLLIVANTPSPNTLRLRDEVVRGAQTSDLRLNVKAPQEAGVADVLDCDGIIIGTTENFAYMSGLIKDFFERIYYPCLAQTQARPVALYIRAGIDGAGTKNSVERVFSGLKWRQVQAPLMLCGAFDEGFLPQCFELGAAMAVGVQMGIY